MHLFRTNAYRPYLITPREIHFAYADGENQFSSLSASGLLSIIAYVYLEFMKQKETVKSLDFTELPDLKVQAPNRIYLSLKTQSICES